MNTRDAIRRLRQSETGQSMVEFAMTGALLVTMLFAVIDLGRVAFIDTMLTSAAQAGARAGSVTVNSSQIMSAAQARLTMVNPQDVTFSPPPERNSQYTEVTLRYTFQPVTPFVTFFIGEGGIPLVKTARSKNVGGQ